MLGSVKAGPSYSLDKWRAEVKSWTIRKRKEQNTLVRFHQLPSEIATDILWLSIVDPWKRRPAYSFLKRLRIISSVCSFWRTVVECTPRFWSIIEFTSPPQTIHTLLEKSKCCPLEVKCVLNGFLDYIISHSGKWDLIAPHTHRIRSLNLSAFSTDGVLAVLGKPAPRLEELTLRFRYWDSIRPMDLFCGQAGRLKDVVLENLPARWDSGALMGLRSLEIKGNLAYSPTETEVLHLLEANPGLEKIEIEDVTVPEGFHNSLGSTRVSGKRSRVTMSNMQDMRLLSLPFELVRVVLETVEIPSIRHLDVKCQFQGHPASQLLGPNIKHLVSPIIQGSTGAQLVQLTIGEESVGLAIYLPSQHVPTIRLQANDTVPVSGFRWLAEHIFAEDGLPAVGAPDVFHVSLKFGNNFDMEGGAFIPILDELGTVKVKYLTIGDGCSHPEHLIRYLGEMERGYRWPLPDLMSLTMGGSADTATHLLRALQGRKRGADLTGMATLEKLDIEGLGVIDARVEGALAELIGPKGTFIHATRLSLSSRSSSNESIRSFESWRYRSRAFDSD